MDIVSRLSNEISDVLAPLLPKGCRPALIDYPDAGNCGDHAIWLGEKALLARLGITPAYECSVQSYDREAMAAAIGDAPILMHGGGNFGDRYKFYHEFRMRVLREFPNNPVIVLPQQVSFLDNAYLQQSAEQYAAHPNVTLLARGVLAYHLLARYFGAHAKVLMASDMAFVLGRQERPHAGFYDIVWIGRTDGETTNANWMHSVSNLAEQPEQYMQLPISSSGVALDVMARRIGNALLATDWYSIVYRNDAEKDAARALDYDRRSGMYVETAFFLLSIGHVVVTDRLHAHILCLLLGIPHVLLNNDSGKCWNFYDAWTRESPLCRLASSPAEALALALEAAPRAKKLGSAVGEQWSWQPDRPAAGSIGW